MAFHMEGHFFMEPLTGLEPVTCALRGRCSTALSYNGLLISSASISIPLQNGKFWGLYNLPGKEQSSKRCKRADNTV